LTTIYDRLAARYAATSHRRFYMRVVDELVGAGDPTLDGRGLDLACGVGASTVSLWRAFPAVDWMGLDRSLPMLARFRRCPELARVPRLRAAAERLPLADACLSLVVCSFALHWMEPAALVEVARVLAPGGRLLIAAPLRAPSPALSGNRLLGQTLLTERRRLAGRSRAGFTVPEIESAFSAWHLQALRVVTFGERYSSEESLFRSLAARGALAALFGTNAAQIAVRLSARSARVPLRFGWPVALAAASPRAVAAARSSGRGAGEALHRERRQVQARAAGADQLGDGFPGDGRQQDAAPEVPGGQQEPADRGALAEDGKMVGRIWAQPAPGVSHARLSEPTDENGRE
jgi:ubiquinone/menaquinone biosynthesis C-methylase UbiE